jgi:AraC-like DNA-binding protein
MPTAAKILVFADRSMAVDRVTASFQVGYGSPSQFSREYRRLFGTSPLRDIRSLQVAEDYLRDDHGLRRVRLRRTGGREFPRAPSATAPVSTAP